MEDRRKGTARFETLRNLYVCRPELDFERARHFTESYKQTDGMVSTMRRALAFKNVMEKRTITIWPGELLVGSSTSKLKGSHVTAELRADWLEEEIHTIHTRPLDKFQEVPDEDKKIFFEEILPYWKGKGLHDVWKTTLPEEIKNSCNVFGSVGFADQEFYGGHFAFNHDRLLKLGIKGIRDEVEAEYRNCTFTSEANYKKAMFLEAMLVELDALITYCNRFGDEAERLAGIEEDAIRKDELIEIARICRKVATERPDTFREALQLIWFVHIGIFNEGPQFAICYNRIDQYLLPYYRRDLETGILTKEHALELLTLLLLKVNDAIVVMKEQMDRVSAGFPLDHTMMIGGVDKDGKDAVNELSYLLLDAEEIVALPLNDVCLRISKENPDDWVIKALTVARNLHGKLKFFSDDTAIPMLLQDGKTMEQAREFSVSGCWELAGQESWDNVHRFCSLPFYLEQALANGYNRGVQMKWGIETGDPRKFQSIDEIWDAYRKQLENDVPKWVIMDNTLDVLYDEYAPLPLLASMYPKCIQEGSNLLKMNNHSIRAFPCAGAPNVGDSITAIDELVFKQKKYTMSDIIDALDANYEGYDQLLKNIEACPKYGNDNDEADANVQKALDIAGDIFSKYSTYYGLPYRGAAAVATATLFFGLVCGATPDGRRANQPLSDGGLSPAQGRNVSGPMATLRSVSKINLCQAKMTQGSVCNMRISQDSVKGDEEIRKLNAMVRTFLENGGYHVQFNFMTPGLLREAQAHPENYKDLLVRVATYSAFFVEVGEDLQNDIINRLEYDGEL